MPRQRDLGPLMHINAEAIGQPGQRRFRLRVISVGEEYAALWLEKEQMIALGEAVDNVLRDAGFEYQARPLDDLPEEPVFPLRPAIDFRITQLSMGVDREHRTVVLIAADGPEDDDETTATTMTIDYRMAYDLRQEITRVAAAGRPPCPLCTAPMDPSGHVCVRTNGHNPP